MKGNENGSMRCYTDTQICELKEKVDAPRPRAGMELGSLSMAWRSAMDRQIWYRRNSRCSTQEYVFRIISTLVCRIFREDVDDNI